MADRVAVFGGSFSPFGKHHLDVLNHVVELGEFTRILVVPSIAHALKGTTFPYEHRANMVEIALSHTRFKIPVELSMAELHMLKHQPGPIFTIQLLRWLRKAMPENSEIELRFVVGPDIIEELDRWKYVEDIRREFGFVEVPNFGIRATDIRQMMLDGLPSWKQHVPPPVAEYIEMHQLYNVARVNCDHEWENTKIQPSFAPHREQCGKCDLPKPGSEVTP